MTIDYLLLILQFFFTKYCVIDPLRGTLYSVLVSNASPLRFVHVLVLATQRKEILNLQIKPCRPVTHNLNYPTLVSLNPTEASVTAGHRPHTLAAATHI